MIAIVGGGIAGLAAAFELTKRRVPFTLFEAAPRAGGLIRTEHAGGFTLDAAADSLLAQKPAALELCAELGLSPRLITMKVPRTAFVLRGGRLHALPSPSLLGIPLTWGGLLGYRLLPPTARLRLAAERWVPPATDADESVAAFFRRRFGAATVGLIAEPLLGGIHAGDVERLSMREVFPRLVDLERRPGGVLTNARGRSQPDPDGMFRALENGMGELVDAILAALPPHAVRLETAVESLERRENGWRVQTRGGRHDAAAIVLATPAHAAAPLVRRVDARAADLCAAVPYASTVSVALGFRRDDVAHPLRGSGFVVARRHNMMRLTACTWVSSKWNHRAPEGHVLLRAFAGGIHDPGVVDVSDNDLVSLAVTELTPLLGISAPPVLRRVFRARRAGAQHNVGHAAAMAELRSRLPREAGLFLAGSGFESIGIPDCVANGRATAAAAADYVRMDA